MKGKDLMDEANEWIDKDDKHYFLGEIRHRAMEVKTAKSNLKQKEKDLQELKDMKLEDFIDSRTRRREET